MNIVFYTGYHHCEWNAYTDGLGGSETAVIEIAKRLAEIDNKHKVMVVGANIIPDFIDGVTYLKTDEAKQVLSGQDVHTLIGVNYIHFLEEMGHLNAKQNIFWLHNMEHFPYHNGEVMANNGDYVYQDPRLTIVLCVSQYQRDVVAQTFPDIAGKLRVVGNGINTVGEYPSESYDIIPRRFIYSSAADRGLDKVLELWPGIKSKYMDAELVVCTPSYAMGDFSDRIQAMEQLGVTIKGNLSKKELYKEIVQCEFWIYPTTYDETFCITALEMLYGSCIPLTTDAGNLKHLIADPKRGLTISHTLEGAEFNNAFMDIVDQGINMSEEDKFNLRESNWDYGTDNIWAYQGNLFYHLIKDREVDEVIERIFIISLDPSNKEKRNRWNEQLRIAGLGHIPTEMVMAINGNVIDDNYKARRGIDLYPWTIESDNDWWTREMKPGEIGCALSHYGTWKLIVERNLRGALILEEDFKASGVFNQTISNSLPIDWDMLYLGRNPLEQDRGIINDHIVSPGASYNLHAYALSKHGATKLLQHKFKESLMPVDEFIIGTYTTHPRKDLHWIWSDSTAYAVANDIFTQTSNESISTTEHIEDYQVGQPLPPIDKDGANGKIVNVDLFADSELPEPAPMNIEGYVEEVQAHHRVPNRGVTGPGSVVVEETQLQTIPVKQYSRLHPELFDYFNDREAWWGKFLQPGVITKEWGLLYDEPIDGVICLPFFNDLFCRFIAEEAEHLNEWTVDRHEFYPTTDILVEKIGFNDIFNDLLREFVMPMSIHHFGLEGEGWDAMRAENFLARYQPEAQGHLAIHHDASDLSALINLSQPDVDFTGGGTWFHRQRKLYRPMKGSLSIHPGNITHKHGARPVLTGKRYIMVSFMKNTVKF